MSADAEWRWADPRGQQRLVRFDELRAALVDGVIPPNAPVWKRGWTEWVPASDVPELMSQAIAAVNGVVPNIPPPPLFVVAAQSEFESHTPKRQQSIYDEPPPPPPYVPQATPSSQPSLQGSPPPAASSKPRSDESVNRMKTAKKQTMLGMPTQSPQPAPVAAAAPAIVASAQTGSSGSDQLKRALPQDAPPSSRFGADQTGSKMQQNLPTVVGVPAIADPRTSAGQSTKIETPFYGAIRTEKKSDPPRPPSARPPPPEPMLKRPTLILYGGAPQEEEQERASNAPNAPPIVATAPGAPAGKNAVTQAPPWDKGAVELGPEIPKNAPTPRMPSSSDEISESLFIEATDAGPKIVGRSQPPPAPKKSSIPPPFRPKSLPPPIPGGAMTSSGPGPGLHAIPLSGRTKRPPPFVPNHTPSFTIGEPNAIPPIAEVPQFEPDPAATTNQLPAASDGDADTTSHYQPVVDAGGGQSFLVHLNPLVAKFPKLAPTRDKLAKFEEGKPKFLLPILAGVTAVVGLIFFVVIVKSIFGAIFGHSDDVTATNKPAASSSSSAVASTASATHSVAVVPPPPPTTTAAPATRPPCAVIGNPKTIAPKALVATGVEVVAATNSILVGFASGPKDGAALSINPANLSISGQTKTKSSDPLKRVEPLPADGRPQVSPNTDKKGDSLTGRRTVPSSPSFDLGVADGALAWAPRGTEKINPLWPLNGSGPVEALRGAPLDGGGGIAVAYRRAGAIWIGVATGDKNNLSAGNLSSTQGLGPQVGSPAIAASGNSILAIWADRASASDAWGLRWQRWKIGDAPTAAEEFTPPAGGPGAPFMSPGVASLGGGRFLIVWTEGSGQGHQVRALTIGADGQAQGLPLTISADGENAGQGQAAVTADGRGVVAYLASSGPKAFQLSATSITCPK